MTSKEYRLFAGNSIVIRENSSLEAEQCAIVLAIVLRVAVQISYHVTASVHEIS